MRRQTAQKKRAKKQSGPSRCSLAVIADDDDDVPSDNDEGNYDEGEGEEEEELTEPEDLGSDDASEPPPPMKGRQAKKLPKLTPKAKAKGKAVLPKPKKSSAAPFDMAEFMTQITLQMQTMVNTAVGTASQPSSAKINIEEEIEAAKIEAAKTSKGKHTVFPDEEEEEEGHKSKKPKR